jgi:hypothetical protein
MITGSTASSAHGAERTTRDIDLVIDPDLASLRRLLASLPPKDYYVSEEAAREALLRRGQFNVVDVSTGWKLDLIVRKSRAWSEEEFRRRVPTRLLGVAAYIATPEDVILSKLEWARAGESERQLEDAAGILAVQGPGLDRAYLERWARELEVTDLWERVNRMAGSGEEKSG